MELYQKSILLEGYQIIFASVIFVFLSLWPQWLNFTTESAKKAQRGTEFLQREIILYNLYLFYL